MVIRPQVKDLKLIGYYTGKIINGIGILMMIPLLTSLVFLEFSAALDFLIGILACFTFGKLMKLVCQTGDDLGWIHGFAIASFSWIAAMIFGAIPHYLSGHYLSYLDACFDLMSGYTTTGLVLIQNLDHVSHGMNMWRHLLTYAGGQGIIVIALTFMLKGASGAVKMYIGEGKDEKLLPNVIQTARAIWLVSLVYMVIGSGVLTVVNLLEGLNPLNSILHATWLFMGAWSTGGFAPQSQNLLYYHSLWIELVTMVIFIIGSLNFAVHWTVWNQKRIEMFRNIETVSFTVTSLALFALLCVALNKTGVYPEAVSFFRKSVYILLSGHTTTGNQTVYSRSFIKEWGELGMVAIAIAMAIGGSACSTAGGFKGMRMGLIYKGLRKEIKKMVLPESSIITQRYHHIREQLLTDDVFRQALLIVLCYVVLFMGGTILGMLYGYAPADAMFDAVSAGSNTGLSCGVATASMPALLKIYYMVAMWAGRLEFTALFALLGFGITFIKGK